MSLRSQISRLTRHSAIYAISTAMQRMPGLLMIPFYTNENYIATTADFGNYVLVFTFIAFMNFFYLLGLDSAMMRYFFLDNQDRKEVFSATFWVMLLSCTIMSGLIIIFDKQLAELLLDDITQVHLIHLAAVIPLIDAYVNLAYNVLRAEEKPVHFTVLKSIRFTMEILFNILFVIYLKMGVPGIFYTSLTAAGLNLLMILPIIMRYLKLKLNWALAKMLLAFGLPLLPNGIAFMTIELVDNFLVKSLLSKEQVAIYRANYRFAALMLMLITAFRNAWQPFFLKVALQENARTIYARVLTYYVIAAGLFTVFISYFIGDILTYRFFGKFSILNEPVYWQGTGIIPLILLSYFVFGMYVIFTPGFYIEKKSRYMVLFTGLGAMVNIGANLWLLPLTDSFWGAAYATLISYLAMTVAIYVVARKIYPIPWEWGRVLPMICLISIAIVVFYLMQPGFIWRICLLFGILIISITGILNRREREIARQFLHKTFKKVS